MMKFLSHALLPALFVATMVGAQATPDISDFNLQKYALYEQSGPSAVSPDPNAPYEFSAGIFPNSGVGFLSSTTVSTPAGGVGTVSPEIGSSGAYALGFFPSVAALNAACPSGTYNFVVHTTTPNTYTFQYALPPGNFPAVPQITSVTNATWVNGVLKVTDPSQDVILNWPSFSTSNGGIVFAINSASINQVFQPNGTNTSYKITAGTLATNAQYVVTLLFQDENASGASPLQGVNAQAGYVSQLSFIIQYGTVTASHTSSTVIKSHVLKQTSNGTPANASGSQVDPAPYNAQFTSSVSGTVTGPGASGSFALALKPDNDQWDYASAPIATTKALNLAFPDGNYILANTDTVTLSGDVYPNATTPPQILAVNGAPPIWDSFGRLELNPAIINVLSFTPYSGSNANFTFANGGAETVNLSSYTGDGTVIKQQSGVNSSGSTPFSMVTLTAASMQPNFTYVGKIKYILISSANTSNPNHLEAAGYATETTFNVVADPVGAVSQQVTFAPIPDQVLGVAPLTLSASASSHLPVGFVVVSGPATVSGTKLTITGTGSVQVEAIQNGNATFAAAEQTQSFNVGPGSATITLGGLSAIYNGSPHAATVTTKPAGLSTSVLYNGSATAPTNAGSYPVTATITTPGYSGNATGTLTINPAAAKIVLTNLTAAYDGNPHGVTVTTTPANLSTSVTYGGSATVPAAVGSYAVVATITDPNATGSSKGTLVISKGTATVVLGSLSPTFDGNPHAATAMTTPSGLDVTFTYGGKTTVPVAVGSYAVVGTVNDPNYVGGAKGTLVIGKAAATVTFGNLAFNYNGAAHPATATTNPVGLTVTYTYNGKTTLPVNVGSYTVVGTIVDANHAGGNTGTLTISLAPPTVYLGAADAEASYWVNPGGVATTVSFEYSTDPNFGTYVQTTPEVLGKGTVPLDVYALFPGLLPGTVYYYRIVTTTTGAPVSGPAETFTTLGFDTTLVAATGQSAPGTGFNFASLGNAAVDALDGVAFGAKTSSTVATSNAGIWANQGGSSPVLIAQTGSTALGTGGAVFATLTDPVVIYDGTHEDVAFGGTLKVTSGLVTTATENGVWASSGGTPGLIAREGDTAPGAGTATFATFNSLGLSDTGAIFSATLATSASAGVTAANNIGVWEVVSGNLTLMLRTSATVTTDTTLNPVKTIGSFGFLPMETFVNGQTRGFGPTTGHLAANTTYTDKTTGIVTVTTPGSPTAVVTSTDPAAGTAGATFATFSSPAINDNDHVAFAATLALGVGDTTKTSAGGIWADDATGTRQLVARLGSVAPGTGTSATFLTLSDPAYNLHEAVAFRGTLSVGTGLATATTASGLWCNSAGPLALVAQQGGQAPGCPAGTTFSAFTELALDDVDGATQQGGVIFLATLSGTGVTSANNTGIFAEDDTGTLQLIVRTGDVLTGKTVTALAFLPQETLVNGQARSFSPSTGDLVYNATFSDKSQAIFNVVFP
jgi:hypothetical protein